MATGQYGTIFLVHTDEICEDLEWFCDRYPLEMAPCDRRLLLEGADRSRSRVLNVQRILSGQFQLPAGLQMTHPPRAYQEQGAAAVLSRGSCLLVDDLGLGKTVTAIRVMAHADALPALAVVPAPLTGQWAEEIVRFLPMLDVHVLRSGTPYDIAAANKGHDPHVIVTSYHKLAGWADHLAGLIRFVVFDEAQELRTGGHAQKNAAAAHVATKASFRMGLTATPVYNYGGEIWNVINVLAPGELGSRDEFLREWCAGSDERTARLVDPLAFFSYARASGVMLRRTRKDVGRQLPPVNRVIHHVTCRTDSTDWGADSAAMELAKVILSDAAPNFERMQAAAHFDAILRQATGVSKAPEVAALVRMLVEGGQKVVLFGWHRQVYELWGEILADLKPAWYTGSESTAKKQRESSRFLEGDTDLLIMSLRSGLGLNGLQTVCSTAVFGELDWSPGVHEQCVGRLDRDGQTEPVFAYYAIGDDGSDPVVCDVLGIKAGQVEGVRGGEAVVQTRVDPDHIKRLAKSYLARRKR